MIKEKSNQREYTSDDRESTRELIDLHEKADGLCDWWLGQESRGCNERREPDTSNYITDRTEERPKDAVRYERHKELGWIEEAECAPFFIGREKGSA